MKCFSNVVSSNRYDGIILSSSYALSIVPSSLCSFVSIIIHEHMNMFVIKGHFCVDRFAHPHTHHTHTLNHSPLSRRRRRCGQCHVGNIQPPHAPGPQLHLLAMVLRRHRCVAKAGSIRCAFARTHTLSCRSLLPPYPLPTILSHSCSLTYSSQQICTMFDTGLIAAFMDKAAATQHLAAGPVGAFVIRCSDSELGGLCVSFVESTHKVPHLQLERFVLWVTHTQAHTSTTWHCCSLTLRPPPLMHQVSHVEPWNFKDFAMLSLADRIRDLKRVRVVSLFTSCCCLRRVVPTTTTTSTGCQCSHCLQLTLLFTTGQPKDAAFAAYYTPRALVTRRLVLLAPAVMCC